MKIDVINLGRMEYAKALEVQQEKWEKVSKEEERDTLFLVEHPPVLTLGVRGKKENILIPEDELIKLGVSIQQVSRGGDVTYHGPGQIVGYPVMNLKHFGRDIHYYVERIENTFIKLLKDDYGITADRGDKTYTGVWVGNNKITAIGIQVKRWTTMHGFAFNVNTNLSHFNWIVPCGLTDRGVTSLEKLTNKKQDMEKLFRRTAEVFCESFGVTPNFMEFRE
ncbi:MAG: lipoyl(octanoyl) transferase LipB [Clostridiaceae bacterium]|nr:lipoyl(octanoyl) transferase LipB [Clostridiaceae bacterium]